MIRKWRARTTLREGCASGVAADATPPRAAQHLQSRGQPDHRFASRGTLCECMLPAVTSSLRRLTDAAANESPLTPRARHMISIFNDVIGPVMRGASSSHCAAALRIGRLARDLMNADLTHVLVEFDVNGSLPNTHQSQGSDMGLFGGLLGWDAADDRLPMSPTALREAGVHVDIRYIDCHDPHPNTYRLTLSNARESHTLMAISTGGGMIQVIAIDGAPVRIDGGAHVTIGDRELHPVLPVLSQPNAVLPFST